MAGVRDSEESVATRKTTLPLRAEGGGQLPYNHFGLSTQSTVASVGRGDEHACSVINVIKVHPLEKKRTQGLGISVDPLH